MLTTPPEKCIITAAALECEKACDGDGDHESKFALPRNHPPNLSTLSDIKSTHTFANL